MDYSILYLMAFFEMDEVKILLLLLINLFLLWKMFKQMFKSPHWRWYVVFFLLVNGFALYGLWSELIPKYHYWNN